MDLTDCTVDHDAFHVWVAGYGVKYPFKNIGFDPVPETLEDSVPVAKLQRKVAPRRSGSSNPQNGFHEKATVPARAARVACLPKTMRLHQSPLRIGDDKSVAQNSILLFARSESELMPNVNPESQQALHDASADHSAGSEEK